MKTILVDGISGLILKDGTLQQEMYDLLEQYPNPKLVLTGANDKQWKQFNLDISKYYLTGTIWLLMMSSTLNIAEKQRTRPRP